MSELAEATGASAPRRWALPDTSRRQQVVDLLRDAIITGELAAGARLKQDWLCGQFGVSPGPIREALRQLESEGLVEHHPNRGTFVTDVSAEEYLGVLLPVRTAIETYAVPLATSRMSSATMAELEDLVARMVTEAEAGSLQTINELDLRFHEITVEAAASVHALQLWRAVAPRIRAQIYRLSPRHPDMREIAREHQQLLNALKGGDPQRVRQAVEEHIIGSAQKLLAATPEHLPTDSLH